MLRRLFRLVLGVTLLGIVAVAVVALVLWRELARDLPPVDELLRYRPPAATLVYAANGEVIAEFFEERRYPVRLEEVPEHVKQAFFAAEDTEFHSHHGVDFSAIARAFLANLQRKQIVQGGSTITQQVVKQLLLSPERSYERKLKEVILAQQLEAKLPKEKILELYLNEIYFGAGAYGLSAAADTYFGRDVTDLSVAQAALLAGLAKAPSRYNPLVKPEAAIARQHYVLQRMLRERFLSPQAYRQALTEKLHFGGRRLSTYAVAPWYVEHVRRLLEDRFGASFLSRGLHVHTAVDLDMQSAAQTALVDGLRTVEKRWGLPVSLEHVSNDRVDSYLAGQSTTHPRGGPQKAVVTEVVRSGEGAGLRIRTPWEAGFVPSDELIGARGRLSPARFRRGDVVAVEPVETETGDDEGGGSVALFALDRDPLVEGALVALEPDTGLVRALVGGVDYARSQFNRAVLAHRQPGSAFKPFVFAAAIDRGMTPESVVEDAPISLPNGARGFWSPRNFGDKYYGPVTLRKALCKSLNSVTVRLEERIGIDPLRDYLDIFGFTTRFPRHAAIVLGSSEVSPLELARAYAVFATEGRRIEPVFITSITDAQGQPVEFPESNARFLPVMKPRTARILTDMLASNVQTGTGRAALALKRPAAGKTGTTNDSKDAWFVGFTPDLVAAVWIGFDSGRPLGRRVTGGAAAAPIWTQFMIQALDDRPVRDFTPPKISAVAPPPNAFPDEAVGLAPAAPAGDPVEAAPPGAAVVPTVEEKRP